MSVADADLNELRRWSVFVVVNCHPSEDGKHLRNARGHKVKWQHKAHLMRAMAQIPLGDRLYKVVQKRFGRLSADPMRRLPTAAELARWAIGAGRPVEGSTVLEVGTGHKPIVPVGLFLLGAKRIYTYDLYRRLDVSLMRKALEWIAKNRDAIRELYGGLTSADGLEARLAVLAKHAHAPLTFFSEAGIVYQAPADAAHTALPAGSVDLHVSVTVLEHVPPGVISEIFAEAWRLKSPTGIAIHFVDPSDHFSHQDPSISAINFLQFSTQQWARIAGNQFAYCNRLRRSELLQLFMRNGFSLGRAEYEIDTKARAALDNGFPLHTDYRDLEIPDLCATRVRVLLR